jgi:predicted ATP-grasp superfamily ATP-dependent carboligase
VRLLSTNFGALSESFHLSVDIWDRVIKFFDKRLSYPLADATGIPIPHTFYPQSVTDLNRMLGVIPYPCIIKPAIMLDFYKAFNKKVLLCNTEVELVSNYQFASKTIAASELMIQEVIPGDSSNQYSVGIFFGKDKTYNHLIARRKRQHPIDFGNATTYAETVNIPLLLHYAEKLLAASEYTGVCEVEFKYDARDGLYKFLEVNPRLWKWHAIAKQCDVPLLESMFSYYTKGMPLQTTLYKEASWRDIVTDTKVVLELLLKKKHISIDNKPEIQAVFNTKDILPFIMQLLYLPCFVFSKNRDCGV